MWIFAWIPRGTEDKGFFAPQLKNILSYYSVDGTLTSRMDGDPNKRWKEMEGWMLIRYAFVFLWAGFPRLQLLVANRANMSEAGGLVGLHFMWVHAVPSIRRTAAPRGHLVERAAWPPLLRTHQTFVPVINTHIRNALKYCRSKHKMNRMRGRRQLFLLCFGKQVQKLGTKLNNNLQKSQSRNIKQIFLQTAFICSIWSHWPLSSTHPVLFSG